MDRNGQIWVIRNRLISQTTRVQIPVKYLELLLLILAFGVLFDARKDVDFNILFFKNKQNIPHNFVHLPMFFCLELMNKYVVTNQQISNYRIKLVMTVHRSLDNAT